MTCDICRTLLSEGLDLCVRARELDAQERSVTTLSASRDPEGWKASGQFDRYRERHNVEHPETPLSMRCATPALWVQDQYDRDLFDWQTRARQHLSTGCKT